MTKRASNALEKLYTAFYEGRLHPACCTACAVGNICDASDVWKHFTDAHGSQKLTYVGSVNETFKKRINGYLPSELLAIEATFLRGCGYDLPIRRGSFKPTHPQSEEVLFNGLRAVVHHICELDGISDVMAISDSFLERLLSVCDKRSIKPSVSIS
ncbi:Na(+)-translocating NADH-quinone reductase subunit F [Dokdonia sp. Hel_I_53]|uniref:Na(+)-translocating NADH-quinone reductase subunit F n=1 Tax=Dokdonia sp. Hel_I_53 TaxID=1566287 RepID=UPI00119C4BE2|nr:Na(+)-translocating NADH-quinone reductase subunit F [Dokdonia sp. Hel_I_53]TVZ53341.1 hypothetical protein OD90_2547 [Dokdonia sp. Hel_I_53]